MKVKKYLCALFAALTALTLLIASACDFSSDGKLHIVCTIFPQYDWVRELTEGADNVEVTLLEDSGADLHNFQPSVRQSFYPQFRSLRLYGRGVGRLGKNAP